MKTRIIHTKIWKDAYFRSLNQSEKVLFFYLITNEYVNQIWLYECGIDVMSFETSLKRQEVEKTLEKFRLDRKVFYKEGYVYLINANKFERYLGEKNESAKKNILSLLPKSVLDWYNNILDRGIDRGIDTPPIPTIIHNTEYISNNKIDRVVKRKEEPCPESMPEEDYLKIATDYKVGVGFVKLQFEKLRNYCLSKGKTYTDYKAALRNFVLKDMQQTIERRSNDKYRPVDARGIK